MHKLTLATAIAAGVVAAGTADAKDIVVGMFGGSFHENAETCHIKPFQDATGDTVTVQEGSSSQFAAMIRATGGKSDFDVVYIDNSFAEQLVAEGLLEKLDLSKISNTGDLVTGAIDPNGYYIQYQWGATALAYSPSAYPTAPTSWADVFTEAKNGKVALPDISGTAGVHFLIAAAKLNGGSAIEVRQADAANLSTPGLHFHARFHASGRPPSRRRRGSRQAGAGPLSWRNRHRGGTLGSSHRGARRRPADVPLAGPDRHSAEVT